MLTGTVGHYRIVRLLGSGGMGEVYLADDTKLGRQIALKVLPPELTADAGRRERFEREARAVAALNHPSIVTLHSIDQADATPFLTMEQVDGKALGELIRKSGMPLDRLLKIAIPLADAVGAAHQRGILHRDLKPANVMVTADGRVKVLDFGLAKLQEDVKATEALPTQELTGEGRIVGTVAYMSPEQAEGKAVISDRMSSRSACCSMSWPPASVRSPAIRASRSSQPSSKTRPVRSRSCVRTCRATSRASSSVRSTKILKSAISPPRICGTTYRVCSTI